MLPAASSSTWALASRPAAGPATSSLFGYDPLPVGGIAEVPDVSDSSHPDYVVVAVLAGAALVAFTAGGWYARRR